MKTRSVILVGAAIVGCLTPTPVAHADVPPIPDTVVQWFDEQAPRIIASFSVPTPSSQIAADEYLSYPYGSSVGEPVAVLVWRDSFLDAANPNVSLLEARGDWLAPITVDGRPVGTINAFMETNGRIEWGLDDDSETAAGLMALIPGDVVASDGRNGVFIITGDTARQYGLGAVGIPPATGTIEQLQAAILAQRTKDELAVLAAGGQELTGGAPIDFGQFVGERPGENPNGWSAAGAFAVVMGVSCVAIIYYRRHTAASI